MPRVGKTFRPRSRAEWRRWLAAHHRTAQEIWVLRAKKHVKPPKVSYEELIEEALCFGWIDGIVKRFDDDYQAHRLTPRRPGSIWSVSNKKRVAKLVREGRMTKAGLVHVRAAKKSGEWARAPRRETATPPPDLAQALGGNAAAGEFFSALPPGHRKLWIAWVEDAVKPETRARRIERVVRDSAQKKRIAGL